MLRPEQDAFGLMMERWLRGAPMPEIIERDDGWFGVSAGAPAYFAPFPKWPAHQRRAMRHVRGRVLDVGLGAGRVGLHLMERGHDVLGIDWSPGAVRVARRRGVHRLRLETNRTLTEAIGLYRSCGFEEVAPFNDEAYAHYWFEKALPADDE